MPKKQNLTKNNYEVDLLDKPYIKGYEVKLTEEVNMENFKLMLDNFKELEGQIGRVRDLSKGYKKLDLDGTYTLLNNMYNHKRKTNEVIYKFGAYSNEGRLFGKMSLQGVPRAVRGLLTEHDKSSIYRDLDMNKAHNSICVWFCKRFGIPCDYIEYYVENRDKCLNEWSSLSGQNYDEGKEMVLAMTNGGTIILPEGVDEAPKWLKDYAIQIDFIMNKVVEMYPALAEKIKRKMKDNVYNLAGKTLNNIFCIVENNLLAEMREFCHIHKVKIGTLCFDGLMLYNQWPTDDEFETFVRDMEEYVEERTGFPLKLSEKPLINTIDLSKYKEKIEKKPVFDEEKFKNKMASLEDKIDFDDFDNWNKFVKKQVDPVLIEKLFINTIFEIQTKCKTPHFAVKGVDIDPDFGQKILTFKTHVSNLLTISSPLKKQCFIRVDTAGRYLSSKELVECKSEWVSISIQTILWKLYNDGELEYYDDYCFEPYFMEQSKKLYNKFNLFRGFEMLNDNPHMEEAENNFEETIMYKHITETLSNNDEATYEYVLNFIAHIIQYPAQSVPVIMTFVSDQGAGKDLFYDFLRVLIGSEYCLKFEDIDMYFKNFNQEQAGKLITCLNEVNDGSKDNAMFKKHNTLKGFVAQKDIRVEGKHKDPIKLKYYSRMIAFSQHENSVMIENSDRRVIPIKCSNKNVNNPIYFNPLWEWLTHLDNIKKAFAYFAQRDISSYNPTILPYSELKNKQKINCMNSSLSFLSELWKEYDLEENFKIQTGDLFKVYLGYCKTTNQGNTIKRNTFIKQLEQIGLKQLDTKFRYNINKIKDKQIYTLLNRFECEALSNTRGYHIKKYEVEDMFRKYLRIENFEL